MNWSIVIIAGLVLFAFYIFYININHKMGINANTNQTLQRRFSDENPSSQ